MPTIERISGKFSNQVYQ